MIKCISVWTVLFKSHYYGVEQVSVSCMLEVVTVKIIQVKTLIYEESYK